MKIYREVLIESAEQAEALPDGTVATHRDHWPLEKFRDVWEGCDTTRGHSQVTGWTVLVPVEVKEVNVVAQGILEYDMNGRVVLEQANQPSARDYKRTEFHTAWRPA